MDKHRGFWTVGVEFRDVPINNSIQQVMYARIFPFQSVAANPLQLRCHMHLGIVTIYAVTNAPTA